MIGTYANIINEIKRRVNICVPSLYSTDNFIYIDKANLEGENATNPFLFRHFYIELSDDENGDYAGNYSYTNKTCNLTVSVFYSESGANRTLGTDDINFRAFAMQDCNDLENALRTAITTDDGSTARLIYQGANIDTDGKSIVAIMNYSMPVFLRGTQKVPDLYIGPNQEHALDGGTKFYLVVHSDLAVEAVITSTPAGLTHVSTMALGSGTTSVLECTVAAAGTYVVTITGKTGTSSATVQVYREFIPVTDGSYDIGLVTKQPGTITFSIDPPTGLIVNNGNPLIVAPSSTTILRTWPNPYTVKAEAVLGPDTEMLVCQEADRLDGHDRFTIAFRIKYYPLIYINTTYQTVFALQINTTTTAHFMIQMTNTNTRALRLYWVYSVGVSKTHYGPNWTGNDWVNYIVTYDYDTVAQSGTLITRVDNITPITTAITEANKIGTVVAAQLPYRSLTFRQVGHDLAMYDFYFSRNKTWDQTLVDSFIAKETIDPVNYNYYWPCKNYSNNRNVDIYCQKTGKVIPLKPAYGTWETIDGLATVPMVEAHTIPMVASVAGTYTITATNRIFGVPDSAQESEKYSTATSIVTITQDPLVIFSDPLNLD
jgi:hypothetical protein